MADYTKGTSIRVPACNSTAPALTQLVWIPRPAKPVWRRCACTGKFPIQIRLRHVWYWWDGSAPLIYLSYFFDLPALYASL